MADDARDTLARLLDGTLQDVWHLLSHAGVVAVLRAAHAADVDVMAAAVEAGVAEQVGWVGASTPVSCDFTTGPFPVTDDGRPVFAPVAKEQP